MSALFVLCFLFVLFVRVFMVLSMQCCLLNDQDNWDPDWQLIKYTGMYSPVHNSKKV